MVVNMDLEGTNEVCRVQYFDETMGGAAVSNILPISFDEYMENADQLQSKLKQMDSTDSILLAAAGIKGEMLVNKMKKHIKV